MKFNWEYAVFSSLGMVLLAMTILLPRFASTMNMSRFYHVILFFLAPFFVLGCEALIRFLAKQKKQLYVPILTAIILVPYFLFQTGFVYEVTGAKSWSVPLSKYRMDKVLLYYDYGYVDEKSVFGAQWMSKNLDTEYMQIYVDEVSRYKILTSYGMIRDTAPNVKVLSNTTLLTINGTLYLSQLNIVHGIIVSDKHYTWNSSELYPHLNDMNKIYSNGGSEIYINMTS